MSRTRSLASAAFAASLTALYASNSSAQWADQCDTIGDGEPGLTIAADWNTLGFLPAIDLAERYLDVPGGPVTAVDVCFGSAASDGDMSEYDFYFGPLNDAAALGSAFAWSKSIPILYAPNAALNPNNNHGVSNVSEIITGLAPTGANRVTLPGTDLGGLGLAFVPLVTVGNPNNIYAGPAGQSIFLELGYPVWASASRPPSPPARTIAWTDPLTAYLYPFNGAGGVKSALISKDFVVEQHEVAFGAEVYPGLDEGFYVEFQGFAQENKAVRLSEGAVGDDFSAFVQSGAWDNFLARWGYAPPLPFWDSTTIYHGDDLVYYGDKIWEALWWTQDETPGDDAWGPWQEIASAPDGTAIWTPSRVFTHGDLVVHNGQLYEAQWWWTRDEEPTGAPWTAWALVP